MPDYRRANVPGGTYFFTVNTYRRQTFLTGADVRTALREAIGTVRQTHPFRIDAWVLLPDHLHALWTLPPDDHDFSHRWRVIKRLVTQACAARLHRPEWSTERRRQRHQSTLWQHRFWEHLIRDEDDFNQHVDYLQLEPCEARLCARGQALAVFEFSSLCETGLVAARLGKHDAVIRW